MIYLKNNDNEVIVTLYEKCKNVANPNFLWSITNKDTQINYLFTSTDHSTSPYYYNAFTISVAQTPNYLNGVIDAPVGQYNYEVYEMTNTGDLNLSNAMGMVENGILNIIGTASIPVVFNDKVNIKTFKN